MKTGIAVKASGAGHLPRPAAAAARIQRLGTQSTRPLLLLLLALLITLVIIAEIPGLTQYRVVPGDRLRVPLHAARGVFAPQQPLASSVQQHRLEAMRIFLAQIETARRQGVVGMPPALESNAPVSTALVPHLLALSPDEWQALQQTVLAILETTDPLPITESSVAQVRSQALANLEVHLETADLVQLAQALVWPQIVPNTAITILLAGEEVARADIPLSQAQIAFLAQLGHVSADGHVDRFLSTFPLVLLLTLLTGWAVPKANPHIARRKRELATLLLLILVGLLLIKIQVLQVPWVRYMLPIAGLGMLLRTLAGFRAAIILMLMLSVLAGFLLYVDTHFLLFMNLAALTGIVALRRYSRIWHFVMAGGWVAAMNCLFLVPGEFVQIWQAARNLGPTSGLLALDPHVLFRGPLLMGFVSLVNGVTSASIALVGAYTLSEMTDRVSSFRLAELARPDQPLLSELRVKAPGTYQHTLMVSDIAERAAPIIGSDALLLRVGAYYHDIGKIVHNHLFAENIPENANPHADYTPEESARMIIDHVENGIALGREHRLPPQILDFIREHHGTQVLLPFYAAALESADADNPPDREAFRYPGPIPQSKETSILMLADACEAATRAAKTRDPARIRKVVEEQFALRLRDGSLADSPLTLEEMGRFREAVIDMLNSCQHRREPYPDPDIVLPAPASGRRTSPLSTPQVETPL